MVKRVRKRKRGKAIKPELVYMDTSALIAFFNPNDKNHKRAVEFFESKAVSGARFVIGRPVLMEFLNGASKRAGKKVALELKRLIEASHFVRVENETEEDWERAWEIFERFDDHDGMDVTDCLSFAIMERLGIKEAFTFDGDFEAYGFKRAP
ncbi:type II toxin-antitoxin system VapC family toxin [Palaeococcus ferrophilus]|uniref:type II toxin-antitoxin system VapC family toxin n=1 Tax=Palaeococcus ferrophilus TaxID=83868 RepID=UPI001FDF122B|nr:type II toxin-antitoxin system VapC family toxin [Palaeococcus ferrophilus]